MSSSHIISMWIKHVAHPAPSPGPLTSAQETQCSVSTNLHHSQKALWKAKKEADLLCKPNLEAILNKACASNRRRSQMPWLAHLIQAKHNKCCYVAFWKHTKPKSQDRLAILTFPSGNHQPPSTIIDHEELDHTLLKYSCTHFAKVQGCLFTIDCLQHLLHYDGLTLFGNLVLEGWADMDHLPLTNLQRLSLLISMIKPWPHQCETTHWSASNFKWH